MGKQQVTMTIDSEVAGEFQRLFPNERSSYCNEMMRLKIASSKGDISGVKIELLILKEKELKEQSSILTAELVSISEQIRLFRDQQNKLEQQKLAEEQARLELLTTCSGCGSQMTEAKLKTVNGAQFCKACFMGDNPKMLDALKRNKD